jgi:two-component system CheB/CheR fusion protein
MSFPIVGIGASAGGPESISALLAGIPANTGMAYVFVQHLDPGHGKLFTSAAVMTLL